MPAKKTMKKMALSDFTGGAVQGYIPTTSEELEGDKAEIQKDRDQRRERRENNTAPGSHYGASGAAGASMDWRGMGSKVEQPEFTANDGPKIGGKFGKASNLDWGARGGGDSHKEGKVFGGSGFDEKKDAWSSLASEGRDAFGGAKAQPAEVSSPPERKQFGAGGRKTGGFAQPEFSRAAFGGSEAQQTDSSPNKNAWTSEDGPRRRDARGELSRDVFGGGQSKAVGDEKRSVLRSKKPALVFCSREEFQSSKAKLEAQQEDDKKPLSWSADIVERERVVPEELQEKHRGRIEQEAKADEERKERMASKLAALAAKAEKEGANENRWAPRQPKDGDREEKPRRKTERRERGERAERGERGERGDRGGERGERRGRRGPGSWADDHDRVVEITINKGADELLGVICQNKTLRLQDVRKGTPSSRCGLHRYIKSHRLTHVNGEPVTEMSQVRYAAGGQAKIVLTLDPSESEYEKGEAIAAKQDANKDLSVLRAEPREPVAQDDGMDDVEPEEDFYANAAKDDDRYADEEEEQEDQIPDFKDGDMVMLTEEGCEDITHDDAWDDIPIKKGVAGKVIGWDEEDDCPIVKGPGGEEMGLHPTILQLATDEAIEKYEKTSAFKCRSMRTKDSPADSLRRAEEAARIASQLACNSNFNPLAQPFLPKALRAEVAQTVTDGEELRIDPATGFPAPQTAFLAKYGRQDMWNKAAPASNKPVFVERRYDPYDRRLYTEKEFLARYGRPSYWNEAERYAGAPIPATVPVFGR